MISVLSDRKIKIIFVSVYIYFREACCTLFVFDQSQKKYLNKKTLFNFRRVLTLKPCERTKYRYMQSFLYKLPSIKKCYRFDYSFKIINQVVYFLYIISFVSSVAYLSYARMDSSAPPFLYFLFFERYLRLLNALNFPFQAIYFQFSLSTVLIVVRNVS